MTIAFVCPDSFSDYETVENVLLKNDNITKIICATTNACTLVQSYASKYNIECSRVKGGKEASLKKMVELSDKVILLEYIEYDPKVTKYSRTQIALAYARKINKSLEIVNYNRTEEAQKQLNKLYNEYFVVRAQEEFGIEILSKLSTPFLIKIPENYFRGKRIWYVGQDTFTWYGRYEKDFLKKSNPVTYAIDSYQSFFSDSKNTPIWQYKDALFGDEKDRVICNNIYKCDYIEGYGEWYTASNMITQKGHLNKLEKLITLQADIFKKELEILKPQFVLLMTSHNQDNIAFQKCTDSKIISKPVSNQLSEKELGQIVSDFLPKGTYRTYHPGYLRRMNKNKRDLIFNFLQKNIIE